MEHLGVPRLVSHRLHAAIHGGAIMKGHCALRDSESLEPPATGGLARGRRSFLAADRCPSVSTVVCLPQVRSSFANVVVGGSSPPTSTSVFRRHFGMIAGRGRWPCVVNQISWDDYGPNFVRPTCCRQRVMGGRERTSESQHAGTEIQGLGDLNPHPSQRRLPIRQPLNSGSVAKATAI